MSSEKPKEKSKEEMERVCPSCEGTGKITFTGAKREAQCQKCKGKGWIL
jgi:DnaJ-class molecular chaperone